MNYQGKEKTVIEGAVPPHTGHSAACTTDRASYCPTASFCTPPPVCKDAALPTTGKGGRNSQLVLVFQNPLVLYWISWCFFVLACFVFSVSFHFHGYPF